ncbi:protein TolA [Rhodopseudomonas rhenobacensis]|uniref:protein TolA n=1 Tax=Rhodopseudomonas rhenobacensis TaxID=87461 RepID=UPI0016164AB5
MKVDKTLLASVALHVLVIGYGLVSFSARSLEAPPPESMPVDIISADQLSQITAGSKTGAKDKPKPLVEKIADAKPVDDPVGKISEKPPIETAVAPTPPPKPVEKPVEKKPEPPKPDPPKPVAEEKPKADPKPIEKKPDPPKPDSIAEALKKDESKKPPPKPEAKAAPPPPPPKPKQERTFDQSKIAALLDKRDPTRQAATGAALNSQASLGSSRGTAATLSQSELDALRARLTQLWNVQAGTERPEELIVDIRIRLTPERRLAAPPEIVSRGSSPRYQAAADAAMRAVLQGQPYDMLQAGTYDQWKDMIVTFDPRQMFRS